MSDDKNKIARWDHFRPSNMVIADNQGKYILFSDHEAEVAKYRDALKLLVDDVLADRRLRFKSAAKIEEDFNL